MLPMARVLPGAASARPMPAGARSSGRGATCVRLPLRAGESLSLSLAAGGKMTKTVHPKRDPFAPEPIAFSDCIRKGVDPEPSGPEGLADVRIIRALLQSARKGRPVSLGAFERAQRPPMAMEMRRPPVPSPHLIHAETPSGH